MRKPYRMSRWLLFAGLAAVASLTAGRDPPPRLYGDCRAYPVMKSFTANRITSNDSCTFRLPSFQCGGYCETTAEINSRGVDLKEDGMYELMPMADCKCCEPIKPRKKVLRAGTIPCDGNGLTWDKDFTLTIIKECTCRRCRPSSVLPENKD